MVIKAKRFPMYILLENYLPLNMTILNLCLLWDISLRTRWASWVSGLDWNSSQVSAVSHQILCFQFGLHCCHEQWLPHNPRSYPYSTQVPLWGCPVPQSPYL